MDSRTHEYMEVLGELLKAEGALKPAEGALKDAQLTVKEKKAAIDAIMDRLEAMMREDGVASHDLEGRTCNYRLAFSKPRTLTRIVDIDAVPEEFVATERKPKLKEITEHIKDMKHLPNWVALEQGESKLNYKVVKK